MIGDLKYPEDARKVVDALYQGVAYDAATAVSGIALSKIPLPPDAPNFAVPVRCGGERRPSGAEGRSDSAFSLVTDFNGWSL
jgi:hypothetical protein